MTDRPIERQRGVSCGLFVALVFVVVSGVLGMHGVGSHGVSGADHMPGMHTTNVAVSDHEMVVALDEAISATVPLVVRRVDGAAMSLGELCVAVLSALGLVLLLLQALRRHFAIAPPPSRLLHVRKLSGRDRDPPSLARLSVLRR
jgi:hypothetical protein